MEKETLKKIFNFLEKKDNRNTPLRWKWSNGFPLTEDDLHVKGDLNLSDLEIEELPEGLKVEGDLFLQNSDIKSLPEGLEVDDGINITYTKLTKYTENQLKKMVKPGYIKGIILNEDPDWDETEFAF